MTVVVVMLTVVVVVLALLVVGLLRSHAEILRALHDLGVNVEDGAVQQFALTPQAPQNPPQTLPAGAPAGVPETVARRGLTGAADVSGVTPSGDAVMVGVTGTGRRTLLAFLSSGCTTCEGFWDALADPANRSIGQLGADVVVITRGSDSESPAAVADMSSDGLVTVMSTEAWDDYDVPVSPYFVLVDGSGQHGEVLGEGAAGGWEQLTQLMSRAVADGAMGTRRSRRELLRGGGTGRDRSADADEALLAAGIEPGDPSLYPGGDQS